MDQLALLLGLSAALAWGVAAYLAALTARQFGGWITNMGSALVALVALLPLAVIGMPARSADATLADVVLLASVGIGALLLDYLIYQLLTVAPVAIIYPILASNSAVVTLLAVVVLGEVLTGPQVGGVLLVSVGIFAIAYARDRPPRRPATLADESLAGATLTREPQRSRARAPMQASLRVVLVALAITIVAGVLIFIAADAIKRLGWYQPVLIDRVAGGILLVGLLAAGYPPRRDLRGHGRRWWLILGSVGLLNALAVGAYALGNEVGSTAITATAASTFAAIPVVLGIVLIGERPERHQLAGIVAALVGVALLAAG